MTTDKASTFKEIYRILKNAGGRMVISDLITDREVEDRNSVNPEKWCSCIDGALTKENYLNNIRKAGFKNPEVLEEKLYLEEVEKTHDRKLTSLIVRAVKE